MLNATLLNKCCLLLMVGLWQSPSPARMGEGSFAEITPMTLIKPCAESGPEAPQGQDGTKMARILEQLAQKDLDEDKASKLVESLGQGCDKAAVEPLIDLLLGGPSEKVRLSVVEALGRLGSPDAIGPLNNIVSSENNTVRWAIARTLLSMTSGNGRSVALNSIANPANELKDEADLRLRGSVILTLNELANTAYNRKAILFLYNYMQSTNPNIVRTAEEVMSQLPATRNGSRELIGILKHSNTPQVRVWVCSWLGRLRITESREMLIETAEKDISQPVRTAAAEALKLLGS